MRIEKCGNFVDGREVHRYILENKNGVQAIFTDLGATWLSFLFPDRSGKLVDVVLACEHWEDLMENPGHMGEVVGRNANRIEGGKFQVQGKDYQLFLNDKQHSNCHSGPEYYGRRLFQAKEKGENSICFSIFSKDMDQGFPGNMDFSVTYELTEDNALHIRYQGLSDKDTLMNFTNHAYFNLSGHDRGEIAEQRVQIFASHYTPSDEFLIPTGEIRPVAGTAFDFREEREIFVKSFKQDKELLLAGGYDHNFCVDGEAGSLRRAAVAYSKKTAIEMSVETDCPGIQFYTANFLKAEDLGKGGVSYTPHSGYCFETQYYPNAVNVPEFRSPIVAAGSTYRSESIYRFRQRLI